MSDGDSSDSSVDALPFDEEEFHSDDSELDLPPGEVAPSQADAVCLFSGEEYKSDQRGSLWIQCGVCEEWAHVDCTDSERDAYICDFCRDA